LMGNGHWGLGRPPSQFPVIPLVGKGNCRGRSGPACSWGALPNSGIGWEQEFREVGEKSPPVSVGLHFWMVQLQLSGPLGFLMARWQWSIEVHERWNRAGICNAVCCHGELGKIPWQSPRWRFFFFFDGNQVKKRFGASLGSQDTIILQ